MAVLIPIPPTDFDPTETAVPWAILAQRGHEVVFSTPQGAPGRADDRMLSGRGLGPWKGVLRADTRARELYRRMSDSEAFKRPVPWAELGDRDFDAILLPGGHAPGMRVYLESEALMAAVARHDQAGRPLGAICHGVLLAARTRRDGRSILASRRVTALTRQMELTAWSMTCAWLGDYYRTYPETVEDEVRRALGPGGRFETGPLALLRDSPRHLDRGFSVVTGHLVTARWPGDAHHFASALADRLEATQRRR